MAAQRRRRTPGAYQGALAAVLLVLMSAGGASAVMGHQQQATALASADTSTASGSSTHSIDVEDSRGHGKKGGRRKGRGKARKEKPWPPHLPPASLKPPPRPHPPTPSGKIVIVGTASNKYWNFAMVPQAPVKTGDTLLFQWDNGASHNLWMVGKSDYDGCTTSASSVMLAGGTNGVAKGSYNYLVTASSGTVMYFICTVDGFHCSIGMKIAIAVA